MMLSLKAPAKINLTLEIMRPREDGYHPLRSVMVPVGLYDEIDLNPARDAAFSCDLPGIEAGNLVQRALEAAGVSEPFDVRLRKHIPVGGGLGGGSSDAAAVLRAAMDGRLRGAARDWMATARSLGSDVPFFLCGTGALVEGTGERVTAVGALPPWHALIVKPHASVATGPAYRALDELRGQSGWPDRSRSLSISLDVVEALQRWDFAAVEAGLSNDFHDVVLAAEPAVRAAWEAMSAAGAPRPLLSGSGACLFAIFADAADAERVRERLAQDTIETAFTAPFVSDDAWR